MTAFNEDQLNSILNKIEQLQHDSQSKSANVLLPTSVLEKSGNNDYVQ